MTRERPIIFSGEMVRAVLGERKNQTRRIIKPQPANHGALHQTPAGELWYIYPLDPENRDGPDDPGDRYIRCPYGIPGEHLWVRETWFQEDYPAPDQPVKYRADAPDAHLAWRPSIHMPRWASRIVLKIEAIRVEQLQVISPSDCLAEGCPPLFVYGHPVSGGIPTLLESRSPEEQFQRLWNRLHEHRGHGWEINPWVWVLEFSRM